jgi:hypothetical protein
MAPVFFTSDKIIVLDLSNTFVIDSFNTLFIEIFFISVAFKVDCYVRNLKGRSLSAGGCLSSQAEAHFDKTFGFNVRGFLTSISEQRVRPIETELIFLFDYNHLHLCDRILYILEYQSSNIWANNYFDMRSKFHDRCLIVRDILFQTFGPHPSH